MDMMLTTARQQGMTLIEVMVGIMVLAILLTLAVPSFNETWQRRRLVGAAEAMYSDLQFARLEAIKTNATVTVTLTEGASWQYDVGARTVSGTDYPSVVMDATNTTVTSIAFTAPRGVPPTAGGGTVSFTAQAGSTTYELQVIVSPLGRARICSVGGAGLGYATCP
jgi:prepilin-type N-terminal cleavage/methylation domain-containing protein